MKKPAFVLHDLQFRYNPSDPYVLDTINFTIYDGEYVALLGANGSGKSTLLSCLNGIAAVAAGSVAVYDRKGQILDPSLEQELDAIRQLTATMMQNPDDQIVAGTVEEDIAFGPRSSGFSEQDITGKVNHVLSLLNLEHCRHRAVHSLSGGERQRLALAGILAMDADYLLLDESLSMLDPKARDDFLKLLDSMVETGKTVVHATHSLEEALRSSRCLVLESGKLVFDGTPVQLLSSEHLTDWHFHLPESIAAFRLLSKHIPELSLDDSLGSLEPAALATAIIESNWDKKTLHSTEKVPPLDTVLFPLDKTAAIHETKSPPPLIPHRKFRTDRPASEASPTLQFDKVSYRYPGNTLEALSNFSINVPQGTSVAVIGPSGSGKSTFMLHGNALLTPNSGSLMVEGLQSVDKRTPLHSIRLKASLAVQNLEAALFEHYVADDVAFGPQNKGLSGHALRNAVVSAMHALDLPFDAFADRATTALSGGERRKVALAGVLAQDSPTVLFDEPTAALDGAAQEQVLNLIHELKAKGKTVIVSCHSMEMAAQFDRVAVITGGRLAAYDSPRQVFGACWDTGWGLSLPWTIAVAHELIARKVNLSEPVPLNAAELFNALFSPVQAFPLTQPEKLDKACTIPALPPRYRRYKSGIELFHRKLMPDLVQNSPFRRIDAALKLITVILCACAAFIADSALVSVLITLATVITGALATKTAPKLFRSLALAFPLLLLMLLLQFVFSWQDDRSAVLFSFWRFSLTTQEFLRSISLLCRLCALMALMVLYAAVTTMQESLACIQKALSPLARFGVPVSDISLSITIALRFIPVITNEAECIVTAQLSRGAHGRLKTALSIIIPLFLRTLERSIKLSRALVLRLHSRPTSF
ncbi:MAG: ATP-binding cassette domain-containing protein [Spirochaetaceae bacterium]|jgi:energy-coupling factor transport system ATP-binding protein|nr:ATP-binding cassette domain-containing protein [Spirochaetaceae bacterium]